MNNTRYPCVSEHKCTLVTEEKMQFKVFTCLLIVIKISIGHICYYDYGY